MCCLNIIPPSDASFAACMGAFGILFPLAITNGILLFKPWHILSKYLPILRPLLRWVIKLSLDSLENNELFTVSTHHKIFMKIGKSYFLERSNVFLPSKPVWICSSSCVEQSTGGMETLFEALVLTVFLMVFFDKMLLCMACIIQGKSYNQRHDCLYHNICLLLG